MGVPWSTYLHWWRVGWHYYWRARTRYDAHSPFVARLTEAVLENRDEYYVFGHAITLRAFWEEINQPLDFSTDHGAGSRAGQGQRRTTRELVRHSAVGDTTARQLFHLARLFRPATILELGTNLGFSSLYLRAAAPHARMITLEGHPGVAALAPRTWAMGRVHPPALRIGTFAETLGPALHDLQTVDLAFLDGDHRGAAVLDYAAEIWPHLHADSVLVVSDIHWSADMEEAWEILKKMPQVRLSVDWLHLGLLFFREELLETRHLVQIRACWKPWHWGLWGRL